MTNKMDRGIDFDIYSRSLVSAEDRGISDYDISGNVNINDIIGGTLDVNCCDTYMTGTIIALSDIYTQMKHNVSGFFIVDL